MNNIWAEFSMLLFWITDAGVGLGAKIALGAPLLPVGYVLSLWALRRWSKRSDLLGYLVFLGGGLLAATGVLIMVS